MTVRPAAGSGPAIAAIAAARIIVVATFAESAHAAPIARTLAAAGVTAIEVTFRAPGAPAAIAAACAVPGLLVGAGTVLTKMQVDDAVAAGASFVVSPGLRPALVSYCQSQAIPILPGVVTASEIMTALELGLDVCKFFPAEAMGGAATLDALHGPFPTMRFVPTGGITSDNMGAYLARLNVLAVGGSWMITAPLVAALDLDAIGRAARAAAVRAHDVARAIEPVAGRM